MTANSSKPWRALARLATLLAALTCSNGSAAETPSLRTLLESDLNGSCGCRFGEHPGKTLVQWTNADKRQAVIRDDKQAYRLNLYDEKYFPEKRAVPKVNDRLVLLLSDGNWSIQIASTVSASCGAKTARCQGTDYRARLIVQWEGKNKTQIDGWGRCTC